MMKTGAVTSAFGLVGLLGGASLAQDWFEQIPGAESHGYPRQFFGENVVDFCNRCGCCIITPKSSDAIAAQMRDMTLGTGSDLEDSIHEQIDASIFDALAGNRLPFGSDFCQKCGCCRQSTIEWFVGDELDPMIKPILK